MALGQSDWISFSVVPKAVFKRRKDISHNQLLDYRILSEWTKYVGNET
jgi:hypothetical protein